MLITPTMTPNPQVQTPTSRTAHLCDSANVWGREPVHSPVWAGHGRGRCGHGPAGEVLPAQKLQTGRVSPGRSGPDRAGLHPARQRRWDSRRRDLLNHDERLLEQLVLYIREQVSLSVLMTGWLETLACVSISWQSTFSCSLQLSC